MKRFLLLVLFVTSFAAQAFGGQKITIADEEARVRQILHSLLDDEISPRSTDPLSRPEQTKEGIKEEIEEYKHYLNLLALKAKLSLSRAPQDEPKVGIGYFGQLHSVLEKLRQKSPAVSMEAAYRLFAYLEENKDLWRGPNALVPLPYIDGNLKVGVSLSVQGKILLSLSEQFITKGQHKGVDHGIRYKKGHGLTRLRSYDDVALMEQGVKYEDGAEEEPASKNMGSAPVVGSPNEAMVLVKPPAEGKLTKEVEILHRIKNAEPQGPKRGLVELYSGTHNEILVHTLDGDLEDVYPDETKDGAPLEPKLDLNRLTYAERLEGVSQLTDGLVLLKKLGWVHMDLKFSNLLHDGILQSSRSPSPPLSSSPLSSPLVKHESNPEPFRFAYCDFGEAISMEDVDLSVRPTPGNIFFRAPEVAQGFWYGQNEKEKRSLGFQADVYSHALLSYYLLNIKYFPGLLEANAESDQYVKNQHRLGRIVTGNELYFERRKEHIEKAIRDDLYSFDYDSATHLILRSICSDPRERLTIEQFQFGINYIKTKQTNRSAAPIAEVMKNLEDLHIQSYDIRRLSSALNGARLGNFMLTAFPALELGEDQYRAAVAYLGRGHHGNQLVFKVLDVDPRNADAVRNELRFLVGIGTIQGQLAFQ